MKNYILTVLLIFSSTQFLSADWEKCKGVDGISGTQVLTVAVCNNHIVASSKQGIYFSKDNGDSWDKKVNGFNGTLTWSFAIKENNIYASSAGFGGGVYKTTNYGDSWTFKSNGLNDTNVYAVAVKNDLVVAGTYKSGIFISNDGAETWTQRNNGLSSLDVLSLLITDENIIAGLYHGGVCFSTNNGETWIPKNNGLGNTNVYGIEKMGNNLFLATQIGVYVSSDNGSSWSPRNNGIEDLLITSIIIKENIIIIGTGNSENPNTGIFLSIDYGNQWILVNKGLTHFFITSIAIKDDQIFAATDQGIYRITINDLISLDVPEVNAEKSFCVSPNPASDYILIDSPSIKSGLGGVLEEIRIFDVFGNCLLTVETIHELSLQKIDISALPAGMYFVRIGDVVQKFMVVR